MYKVFIDGKEGTTGLRIFDRLSEMKNIEIITLPEDKRKDISSRKEALNSCDIAFLCLPDDAARESVSLIENSSVKVIDASTAHRTLEEWAYGFPELSAEHFEKIRKSSRVAVPGCHASGFISLVQPLIAGKIIDSSADYSCHSITGYSGGGKKMIAQYESKEKNDLLYAPRQYGLTQMHKHLKEMKKISGLDSEPVFCPIVSDYYSGMLVTVPIFKKNLLKGKTVDDIKNLYKSLYTDSVVFYNDESEDGFLSASKLSGKDCMEISVQGNDDRILLISRFDNLGKGASGSAIECMNIMLGNCKTDGLNL